MHMHSRTPHVAWHQTGTNYFKDLPFKVHDGVASAIDGRSISRRWTKMLPLPLMSGHKARGHSWLISSLIY